MLKRSFSACWQAKRPASQANTHPALNVFLPGALDASQGQKHAKAPLQHSWLITGNLKEPKLTLHTITDPAKLEDELQKIRNQGYAVSMGERVAGSASVALPGYNHKNTVCASLAPAGPVERRWCSRHSTILESHSIRPGVISVSSAGNMRLEDANGKKLLIYSKGGNYQ